jgi:hypothetical protein
MNIVHMTTTENLIWKDIEPGTILVTTNRFMARLKDESEVIWIPSKTVMIVVNVEDDKPILGWINVRLLINGLIHEARRVKRLPLGDLYSCTL